jgi:hypothetical protein
MEWCGASWFINEGGSVGVSLGAGQSEEHFGVNMQTVLASLPSVIFRTASEFGEASFSLFKAKKTKNMIKLLPHGNLRTPYLINSVMMSQQLIEQLSIATGLSAEDVANAVRDVTSAAKKALSNGEGSAFRIEGLCIVYVGKGKIRVSALKHN